MRRTSSLLLLLALLLTLAAGCSTTVRPEAKPIDPVPVILADYGVHSSLMLPTPDGRFVEYSFGDFGYAALNHGGPHNALGALLASGQSGIGRRFLSVAPGQENPNLPAYSPKSMQKFYANRFQVYAMVKELDQRYRRSGDAPVHNPLTDNVFVKDTEQYSVVNNCNHMTARMLRQLGCQISGNTGASGFKVVGRQQLPPAVKTSTARTSELARAKSASPPASKSTSTPARTPATPAGARKPPVKPQLRDSAVTPPTPKSERAIRAASYSRLDDE